MIKAQIKIRWYSDYTFAAYMHFPKELSQNNPVCTDCTWDAEGVEVCNMIFGSTWLAINQQIPFVFMWSLMNGISMRNLTKRSTLAGLTTHLL